MPELKLIDKTAAYKALKHEAETHELSFSVEAYDRAARIIDQMPTIEAEPVRHGRWTKDGCEYRYFYYKCNACGFVNDARSKYCPHCGAKMDGGADNAESD